MRLYNSLTRKVEEVVPREDKKIGMYTCGPTVYFYPHIGNWRTFVLGDLLVRALKYEGYSVDYLMNITDVGHLTGDNLGDASSGDDRLEKAAKREGRTAGDIAEFYTKDFLAGYEKLNLTWPNEKRFCKATEHIQGQIDLVKRIEEKGFTYRISDGIYFDVRAYEAAGNKYGLMSNLHVDNTEARIAENDEKKDKRDFALWKFSPAGEKRQMEWESPWGIGFPGWHVECSAMSMKYLGEQFDIHVGGEDHKSTHHPNEIAQSEAATGKKPFVRYWVHGAFLLVDGGRMGKSLGNAYTLADIGERGYSPMDLRYFYLTGHYRKQLNFTWEALGAAKTALRKLVGHVEKIRVKNKELRIKQDGDLGRVALGFGEKFREAIDNDLNMPEALAVVWQMLGSELGDEQKYGLLIDFDRVLGLGLENSARKFGTEEKVPEEVVRLVKQREELRKEKKWEEADKVRDEIEKLGWVVEDTAEGGKVRKRD